MNSIFVLKKESDGFVYHVEFYKKLPNRHKIKKALQQVCYNHELEDAVKGLHIRGSHLTYGCDYYTVEKVNLK